jgi:hypothetical protein
LVAKVNFLVAFEKIATVYISSPAYTSTYFFCLCHHLFLILYVFLSCNYCFSANNSVSFYSFLYLFIILLLIPLRFHHPFLAHSPVCLYVLLTPPRLAGSTGLSESGERRRPGKVPPASVRVESLAQHKDVPPDFQSNRDTPATRVPPTALSAVATSRIEQLASAKNRCEGPYREPLWQVGGHLLAPACSSVS